MFVQRFSGKLRLLTLALTLGFSLVLALPLTASAHTLHKNQEVFKQKNLVTDDQTVNRAQFTDPLLKNAWGIVAVPDGPFWIADNHTDAATAYDGKGRTIHTPITFNDTEVAPTGIVLNRTHDFVISKNGKSAPALLIFSTESGKLFGWNPKVDPQALREFTAGDGAVYKGLAQGRMGLQNVLFATDFFNSKVDVFDTHFNRIAHFTDADLSGGCTPTNQCFAPFGIRNIGGRLFVTFALQAPGKEDDQAGPGNGFVDIFSTNGTLVRRLVSGNQDPNSPLDSPWGLALAPSHFGKFSNALLVGNFGHVNDTPNASINAFDIKTGKFLGSLTDKHGKAIFIDGLWGLTFGDDVRAADADALYFTAGPNDENNGLFGLLDRED